MIGIGVTVKKILSYRVLPRFVTKNIFNSSFVLIRCYSVISMMIFSTRAIQIILIYENYFFLDRRFFFFKLKQSHVGFYRTFSTTDPIYDNLKGVVHNFHYYVIFLCVDEVSAQNFHPGRTKRKIT